MIYAAHMPSCLSFSFARNVFASCQAQKAKGQGGKKFQLMITRAKDDASIVHDLVQNIQDSHLPC